MTYRVVVGVDGSAHGDAALRWALAQAEARGGEVTAVFAWQQPFISIPGAFNREELEQAAKDFVVEKVSAVAPSPRVPLLPVVAEGDPAEALVVAAKDADLLVVGTRGLSPFMGSVLGAVSLRCAAGADCPVTLVKLAGEKEQAQVPPGPADAEHAVDGRPAPGAQR
jgi:nucleotide-binding universal stress UspA family protein